MTDDKRKSVKILVVEDDDASSAIVVRFLNQMGFSKMVLAVDGNEALNKLYLNKVDLIISDWRMPDMDGLEFYRKAKEEGLLDDTPFLMVSAENEKAKVAEALRAGVNDYILKPVDSIILADKVKKLLNLQK
jgi:two-component system, chemotaxis family, chemotaxis protein CheY